VSSKSLFQQLGALREGLHSLIERIEGGATDEAGIQRALAGCDEAFRALGDLNRIGERVEEAEVEALRGDLQELVRLYAITSSAAHSDLVRVGDMTTRAGEARKSFAYYEGSDEGGTCDMAG